MQTIYIYSSLLTLAFLTFHSKATDQEYSFPPFPDSELAYRYEIIKSKEKNDQGVYNYTYFYQGVKFHTLFNEGSDMVFTVRHRTGGPFELEEIARYQYSCKTQNLFVIKRDFNAYAKGVQIGEGDESIRSLADQLFEKGKENLKTALTATCKLWEPNQQIKNNATFHSVLLVGHSLVLNNMINREKFLTSLMFTIGPDYFFEYRGEEKGKTEAYNLIGITQCNSNDKCWDNYDKHVAMSIMSICFLEQELPATFQSNYCKATEYGIE